MTTSVETNQTQLSHKADPTGPRTQSGFQHRRWFAILLLGTSTLLVAGHYTFGEWIFHPNVALLQESAFWWNGCKIIVWPLGSWLFWTVASFGKLRSASVILTAAGILGLGDLAWYFMWGYQRDRGVGISPDYWFWWAYWGQIVVAGGNIFLTVRWFNLFRLNSIQPIDKDAVPRRLSWVRVGFESAVLLAVVWALFFSFVRAGLPQFVASEWTLTEAREWLVPRELRNDFDFLVLNQSWQWHRYRIAAILANLKLADLHRHQFYTNLDIATYQSYILSPQIDGLPLPDLDWRPALSEYFYRGVRQLNTPRAAAQVVVRYLRERVGIASTFGSDAGVLTIWREGFTDEEGFDRIYVAALRSVDIAARLDSESHAEIWDGKNWEPAPHPLITSFLQHHTSLSPTIRITKYEKN